MRYQNSLEIHDRIEVVLQLIGTGLYSTPTLAKEVGVSIPTVSRIVAALRERGHAIRAQRSEGGWRYLLSEDETPIGHGQRSKTAEKSRELGYHAD